MTNQEAIVNVSEYPTVADQVAKALVSLKEGLFRHGFPMEDLSSYCQTSLRLLFAKSECDHFNVDLELANSTHSRIVFSVEYRYSSQVNVVKDEAGNLYARFEAAQVTVNWPCFGSLNPVEALKSLEFWRAVSQIAANIEIDLAVPTLSLWKTAEEQAKQALKDVVKASCKGMHFDSERRVELTVDVPDGSYFVSNEGPKTYKVDVYRIYYETITKVWALITRTS